MIPVNEPWLTETDQAYVAECVRTGWISSAGTFIDRFERGWADFCGRKHGVAVANGSLALDLAVESLKLEPGFEAILPSFTIISCAQAILHAGGVPVAVDCDPDTWCIDPAAVLKAITPKTRLLMPIHIYGHPAPMEPLLEIAKQHGLKVIEDAAEAHGGEVCVKGDWRRTGSFGDASCFSFYANKIVTTGEGGMVLTDDDGLADELRARRNLCFGRQRRFVHEELGHNFRLTNMQAALGVAQIERIETILERKRWLGKTYSERLQGIAGLKLPVERPWARNVWWMYGVELAESVPFDAEEFARRLKAKGVDTRPFFLGMHEQPALKRLGLFKDLHLPVTERIARRGLYLPSGLTLSEEQMGLVVKAVREVLVS
ncbi:MAG: DegT/DnrJ/EryC1/StrS family aminotransferase [Alphaproteobacteria bacterium]|nr:DegT/DnrJ/EryC1/StrS family aminotransferase [Alphaproteobacteria bacterium]